MISMSSVVVLVDRQTSVQLEGQTVILNLPSGNYYQLDEVGGRVWELVSEPITAAKVCERILAEYDVEPEVAEPDVLQFLEELSSEGLILVLEDGPRGGHVYTRG